MYRTIGLSFLKQDHDKGMQGDFAIRFYVAFWKQESRDFCSKLLKASMHGLLCQPLAVTIPSATSTAWLSLCPKLSFTSLTHSARLACSCHPICVPAGSHMQPQHLRHISSISKRLCWTPTGLCSLHSYCKVLATAWGKYLGDALRGDYLRGDV